MRKINFDITLLILIVLVGTFLRFYKLDWGDGLFTHPDEYHLVISASQLSFPTQMNPNFFSYGTVTIYLMYFTKLLLSTVNHELITVNYFLIGRFFSALFSTLTIFLVYKISRKILPEKYSLLAAAAVALAPGLIQQAHFATPESNLIFFLLASLYFSFNRQFLIAAASLGLALGVKVSGAVFLVPLFLSIYLAGKKIYLFLAIPIIISTLFLVDPYIFLDFPHFYSNFQYESSLAQGKIPVFYTRQFIDTIPVLFQFEKIYPFALGLPLLVFGFLGFILMLKSLILNRKSPEAPLYLLLTTGYLSLFLTNAFLFAKWTRFISPTFPFFAIFSAFFLYRIGRVVPRPYILNSIFLILNTLWATAFFSIYTRPDVRITASRWIEKQIPQNSTFLIESGNMVNLPLGGNFQKEIVNFYEFEENPTLPATDYFIVASRRVFANHKPQEFPKTAAFYNALFSGELGFTQIKEFTSYPRLGGLEFPDENAEETWSVFDHPVIRIFKNAQ